MPPLLEKLRQRGSTPARIAIFVLAIGAALLLGLRLHALFVEPSSLVGSQGAGTAKAPYSDALGPWLHGSMSYYLRGVPMNYLYRPTIGLFFSAIISATDSISAVPVVWLVLFFLACGALFAMAGWAHRAILAGVLGLMVIFFPELIRPLNPETLMADFWPMAMTVVGIWLIALGEGTKPFNLSATAAGFLLLGIAACVRGPQLASGAALLAWLLPGWLKRRAWPALILLPVIFAAPFVTDSLIQKKNGIAGNGSVTLYGFYTDPNHQWSPESHARFLRENPPAAEVRARYLGLLFSREGAEIFAEKCAAVLNPMADLARQGWFLAELAGLALLGWLMRPAIPAVPTSGLRRWGRRGIVALMALAAVTLLGVNHNLIRVLALIGLTGTLLVYAGGSGRTLTALLTLAFCGGLAFHAALGLNGGQRVIGNYEILLFAALLAAVAETPRASPPRPAALQAIAAAVFLLTLAGYTGNFWWHTGFKSQLRAQLAAPQTAVKISNSPEQDRSLYFTGEMGLFYTKFDPVPFGVVRHYAAMKAPDGFGNVTLINPAEVEWVPSDPAKSKP